MCPSLLCSHPAPRKLTVNSHRGCVLAALVLARPVVGLWLPSLNDPLLDLCHTLDPVGLDTGQILSFSFELWIICIMPCPPRPSRCP